MARTRLGHRSRSHAGLATEPAAQPKGRGGFRREAGLLSATSVNMTQMVGIGPFITIPRWWRR
ncbi:MAG TPA: hypothetical protein VFV73_36400 [Streptosporangiaceae bacterium]|nr:hypothetical protein [Streptosporangiaceae bacterium]